MKEDLTTSMFILVSLIFKLSVPSKKKPHHHSATLGPLLEIGLAQFGHNTIKNPILYIFLIFRWNVGIDRTSGGTI